MSKKIELKLADRMEELPPYVFGKLNAVKTARRRVGEDVIDLGMGNPNDPTPQPIVDKLCDAVQDPRNHRYSVSADGIFNLKREVARHYEREWGVEVDPETEVVCTIGSKEGLSHLALVLVDWGDQAIVPTPAFPIHIHSVALAGGKIVSVPLGNDPEFFDNLESKLSELDEKPKLLIVNFPQNPTTMTVEPWFFDRVVDFARRHGIFVIHDFAYSHITFDDYRAPSFLQAEGAKDVGVEFTTMSKSFNMAGWRVGFCVGHSDAVQALSRLKGYYDYGLFMPVQIASIIALRHCREESDKQRKIYEARRDCLCRGLNRIGWPVEPPKGTMFVWAPIPEKYRDMDSVDFSMKVLEEANVAVAPGGAFGPGGDDFVRMALVENELRLKQAVRQIGRGLEL